MIGSSIARIFLKSGGVSFFNFLLKKMGHERDGHRKKCRDCEGKGCPTKYRRVRKVREGDKKCRVDIRLETNPCRDLCKADTGLWNAGLYFPSGSGFINSPTNAGRYNIVDGVVQGVTAFVIDGPGRPVASDFQRAILTLPVPGREPAIDLEDNERFIGTILFVSAVGDGGRKVIIRGNLEFQEPTIARIAPEGLVIAANNVAPTVRPCYQVWIHIKYECAPHQKTCH
jgi:hypothetical protein